MSAGDPADPVPTRQLAERIAALAPQQRAEFVRRLRQKPPFGSAPAPALLRFRPDPDAALRLFCFPYAGGGGSIFRSWADGLPRDIEVCAVAPPGRESRMGEPAHRRIEPLVRELAAAIAPLLDRPFAFFGHSMGALVAFELSRHLRRTSDLQPVRLTLAAFRAPHLPNPNIKIHHLPDEVFKVVLRNDGVADQILQNEELMRAMLPTLRADVEACDRYTYTEEAPLECPMSILGGSSDVRVSAADLAGWRRHAAASWDLTMFPGPHMFLHSAHDEVIAAVRERLVGDLEGMRGRHVA